jgi:hypothetical protein
MNKKIMIPVLVLLTACGGGSHGYKKAEDAQDAGREFIRASLDGDYDKASFYMYSDTTNKMLLDKWKRDYDHMDHEEQKKYRGADIVVYNMQALNDSVTSYTYANSFKKDTTTIQVVRIGGASGDWLVDLKSILNPKR